MNSFIVWNPRPNPHKHHKTKTANVHESGTFWSRILFAVYTMNPESKLSGFIMKWKRIRIPTNPSGNALRIRKLWMWWIRKPLCKRSLTFSTTWSDVRIWRFFLLLPGRYVAFIIQQESRRSQSASRIWEDLKCSQSATRLHWWKSTWSSYASLLTSAAASDA